MYPQALRILKQRGVSLKKRDAPREALLPGKRISRSGATYWETRKNRSDSLNSNV